MYHVWMQQLTIIHQTNQPSKSKELQIPKVWVQGLTNPGISDNKKHRESSSISSQQGRSQKETQRKHTELKSIKPQTS